ncbi:hypothetical protein DMA11_04470 [Marinilabiliaceae bacterium JC017]|nr:hypothetical protein DMA11_04470 [Marinilabiliaceae bacterium JC017]
MRKTFFLLLLITTGTYAQVSFNGYLTEMPSFVYEDIDHNTYLDNMVHNRLNFAWQSSDHFSMAIEQRNRFIWGQTLKSINGYSQFITQDYGWIDMSCNWASGDNYVINSIIDRIWMEYTIKNLQVRLGRQRVNWGMSMVWNPNDIFNAYSYFDFDYEERPGLDGVRVQYFTGYSSKLEGVIKIDYKNRVSMAGLYRFNKAGYDFQVLGGVYNQEDYLMGAGWSGDIKGAGFYGEATYMIPKDKKEDDILIASMGGNYTFRNSLMIQTEMLYSSNLKDMDNNFIQFYFEPASVKTLSMTDFTWFMSASYPATPLLNTSLAVMGFPGVSSFYVGPTMDYSLRDDLYLSFIAQYFGGKVNNEKASSVMSFLRLKWNF